MADGTVRGAFELEARAAVDTLAAVRDRGAEADATLERLGRRMDGLGTSAQRMSAGVSARMGEMSRSVSTQADVIEGRLDRLQGKMRDVGRVTMRPNVDLSGIAQANAALDELELRLARISHDSATARVRVSTSGGGMPGLVGAGGVAGGGAAGGGGRAFSTLGGVGGALPWWAALAPLAPALGGAAVGLGGSALSGALGAGTLGLGAYGALGAGAGLTYAAARPVVTGLQTVMKAQQAYQQAYAAYGPRSAQALSAYRTYQAQLRSHPGSAGAVAGLDAARTSYQSSFSQAQGNLYGGLSGVLSNAAQAMPSLGVSAGITTRAVAGSATQLSGFLTQPAQLAAVRALSGSFAQDLPLVENTLQHVLTIFERLAVDAQPFFTQGLRWVDHWTAGLATASGHTEQVQARMQGYVNSARDWADLSGAALRTIRDLFQAGAPSGDSMVVRLTDTIDRWDAFINSNPQSVQAFFRQAETTTTNIAGAIGHLVHDVMQIANLLDPIVQRATQLVNLVSGMGPGSLGMLGALGYGAYGGIAGRTGLPGAGSLAGAFVTGSYTPGRGGGAVGGTLAGPVAAGASAGEQSFLIPRSGFQAARIYGVGQQDALFAMLGTQTIGRRAIPVGGAAATPEEFQAAYGGVPGARYAMPELVGSQASMIARARGLAGTAVEGAARFAAPVVGITSLLQALQRGGSPPTVAMNTLNNVGSMITLGGSHSAGGAVLGGVLGLGGAGLLGLGTLGTLATGGLAAGLGYTAQSLISPASAGASLQNPQGAASLRSLGQQAAGVTSLAGMSQVQSRATAARIGGLEMSPGDQAKLDAYLHNAWVTAARNAAISASNEFGQAFSEAIAQGQKPRVAVREMMSGIDAELKHLGPQGQRQLATSMAQWVSQMEQENPKLEHPLQRAMDNLTGQLNKTYDHAHHTLGTLQTDFFYFNGQILQGVQNTWPKISTALTDPMQVALDKMNGQFGTIQAEAVHALTMMGFNAGQARSIVTDTVQGGKAAANAKLTVGLNASGLGTFGPLSPKAPAGLGHARGGVIPGDGLQDTVDLGGGHMAAPGEAYIANRHTMKDLTLATMAKFGKTAWQMIRDEGRPHSAPVRLSRGGPMGGGGLSATSYSGYSLPLPRGSMMPGSWSIDQGVDIPAGANTPEFAIGPGVIVGAGISGFGPNAPILRITQGPLAGQEVYYGHAGPNVVPVGAHVSAGQQITEVGAGIVGISTGPHVEMGFYPPGSTGNGSEMATVLRELMSGARVTGVGGGASGAAGSTLPAITLRSGGIGMGGIPGLLGHVGAQAYANGLAAQINSQTGAMGISGAAFSGGGTARANQELGRRMMLTMWGPDQWPPLLALWNRESGWNANATNPTSGAAGIPQDITGNRHGGPAGQIAWGLNYIRGRYGSPAAAEAHEQSAGWYTRGGHIPADQINWAGWNARGGTFTTNGPTLFGAGERGRKETVSITPTGQSGRSIQVVMEHVHLGAGDPATLKQVAESVAGHIIDALDAASGASDSALAGVGGR